MLVVPGGASEALYCSPNEDKLILKSRLGFVRLALQVLLYDQIQSADLCIGCVNGILYRA